MARKTQLAIRFLTIFKRLVNTTPQAKVLLALSGGLDSIVLFDLLISSNVNFEVAHCNFRLRGEESDKDTVLVKELCKKHNIGCHIQFFDCQEHAQNLRISIEMAARDLRYSWFNQLISEFNFSYLATAHHAGDNFETALLNLTKGTGIMGLKGIATVAGKTIRPLLAFTKEELKDHAVVQNLIWREDESNANNEFQRNLLRNKVLPLLKEINPNLEHTFFNSAWRIGLWASISKEKVSVFEKQYQKGNCWELPGHLLQNKDSQVVFVDFLADKGFDIKTIRNFIEKEEHQVGSSFTGQSMELIVERGYFLLRNFEERQAINLELKLNTTSKLPRGQNISIEDCNEALDLNDPLSIYVEKELLHFPLKLREWKQGDKIQPFGMKGRKLVSDILIDKKIPSSQKENTLVLLNAGEVIWILGLKTSEKYRLKDTFNDLVRIKYTI